MNTTYIIAEAAQRIALNNEPYGVFDDIIVCEGQLICLIDETFTVDQVIKWEGTKEQLENVRKGES